MRYIIDEIVNTLHAGGAFVLATVVRSEGSSPRGPGASMLVTADGAQFGTIGGGAVEYAAKRHAVQLYRTKRSETRLYRLNANEIADLGMVCGGRVFVLFAYYAPDAQTTALFERLQSARRAGETAYLVRRLSGGAVQETGVLDAGGLQFAPGIDGALVQGGLSGRVCILEAGDGNGQLLVEPVANNAHVYIFGGGHVSQKLVPVLAYVDFRVTVCEDRKEFADPALFPAAEGTLLHPFDNILRQISVTENDYLVVMTRGHQADYEILRQALKTRATYIGCIGSRHKVAVTRKRLLEEGFSEADFLRVHTPVGLPILAETPEEIAVSIVAQLIEHRAKR